MTRAITRSRIKLLLIFSLFLVPLLVASLWYYGLSTAFSPRGKTNYSPLISPIVTITPFSDKLSDGNTFTLNSVKHIWTIVHFNDVQCLDHCQKSLYNTRQTRIAVGKDANRIQRVFLITNENLGKKVVSEHADLLVIPNPNSELLAQIRSISIREKSGPNDAIMIDPLGNAMMLIPVELNPSLLLQDLRRLLKLSKIG